TAVTAMRLQRRGVAHLPTLCTARVATMARHQIHLHASLRFVLSRKHDRGCGTKSILACTALKGHYLSFLHGNNVSIQTPADVEKVDIVEYLSALAKRELTGIARARKMSALREYFRFLEGVGIITKSPTTGIETPKREKNTRQVLRSDEYTKMLSIASA